MAAAAWRLPEGSKQSLAAAIVSGPGSKNIKRRAECKDKASQKDKKDDADETFHMEAMDVEDIIKLPTKGQLQLYHQYRGMVAGSWVT